MANGSGIVVEHLPHHPNVKGSSPVRAGNMRVEMEKNINGSVSISKILMIQYWLVAVAQW